MVTDDEDEYKNMPPLMEEEEEVEEMPTNTPLGLGLVVRRALTIRIHKDDAQPENIFYTPCQVKNRVYSLVIDSESCANIASAPMVEKIEFPITNHPHPYKF